MMTMIPVDSKRLDDPCSNPAMSLPVLKNPPPQSAYRDSSQDGGSNKNGATHQTETSVHRRGAGGDRRLLLRGRCLLRAVALGGWCGSIGCRWALASSRVGRSWTFAASRVGRSWAFTSGRVGGRSFASSGIGGRAVLGGGGLRSGVFLGCVAGGWSFATSGVDDRAGSLRDGMDLWGWCRCGSRSVPGADTRGADGIGVALGGVAHAGASLLDELLGVSHLTAGAVRHQARGDHVGDLIAAQAEAGEVVSFTADDLGELGDAVLGTLRELIVEDAALSEDGGDERRDDDGLGMHFGCVVL